MRYNLIDVLKPGIYYSVYNTLYIAYGDKTMDAYNDHIGWTRLEYCWIIDDFGSFSVERIGDL
jgi:hypothetical protein